MTVLPAAVFSVILLPLVTVFLVNLAIFTRVEIAIAVFTDKAAVFTVAAGHQLSAF